MHVLPRHKLGKNNEFTKRLNRQTALDLIRRGASNRAELSRLMGLSPQSLSNIFADLEAAGLLSSSGKSYGGKGQPPTNYEIAADCGYGIGLHIDDGYCCTLAVDFAFEVRAVRRKPLRAASAEALYREARDAVRQTIAQAKAPKRKIWGIGVASPRLTNERSNDMWRVEDRLWAEVSAFGLDRRLAEDFDAMVVAENDANTGALGEKLFGCGRNLKSFCYVFLGHGLGCGHIQDGALYRGAWGNAGEIGRILVPVGNNYVHLETILSVDSLLDRIDGGRTGGLSDLESLARDNPEAVNLWLREAAPRLRWLISTLENTADPESIVIGGYLPADLLRRLIAGIEPLHHTIAARDSRDAPRVQAGVLDRDVVAMGAAAMPILATLDPEPNAGWAITGAVLDIYPA
ncbi:MAG TPA: ROK family transcriptional regulator [Dongiaceae bacterium]|nr:ROK family transcriptional regulator [Dongiaceae bacterium]